MRRQEVWLGTWNVTGLGNQEVELLDAMEQYKIDVLGVSETWLKEGESISIPGFKWVGIAGENRSGKGGGVGFLIKESCWKSVREVVEVSKRIFGMSMRIGNKDCWLLQVYAPINEASKDEKERFWESLRDEVEKRRRNASVVIMGDVNGRVGNQSENWDVCGRHGEEVLNENGQNLLELCRGSVMIIMNGWFQHKKAHKLTYVQRMVTQQDREAILDYFCVSRELKSSVIDVRVKRGVEIGSYHHLVLMKIDRGKCAQKGKTKKRRKWRLCVEKLRAEEGIRKFQSKLQEKAVEGPWESVEEEWLALKNSVIEAAEETVGKKKCGGKGKRWWGEEVRKMVQAKKAAYKKWISSGSEEDKKEFRETCKAAKAAVREAKQREWEEFGKAVQKEFDSNSRLFWKKVKEEEMPEWTMLRNDKGELLDEGTRIAEWCHAYFEKLYNEGASIEVVKISGTENQEEESEFTRVPGAREIRELIKKMKNNKAA